MPRWTETDYLKYAQTIAEQHVVAKKSLNELSQKFASEHGLNPEEIRTLVRLANVATFQELFKRKDDGDKMIEFDTGDPESVIRSMVDQAKSPPQTANINNDKLAGEVPDMMRDKRRGFSDAPEEEIKTASDVEVVPPARPDIVAMTLSKLASEFNIARLSAGMRWEQKLGELTKVFRRAPGYGPKFIDFEKSAWAHSDTDVAPEMAFLYEELKIDSPPMSLEKVSMLQERYLAEETPELKLLKEACVARQEHQKMTNALSWVEKNMPAIGR